MVHKMCRFGLKTHQKLYSGWAVPGPAGAAHSAPQTHGWI